MTGDRVVTERLVWRVSVVLVLAALAGSWLGSLIMAIKATGNTDGAVATAVFGVLFVAAALVTWAIDEPVVV